MDNEVLRQKRINQQLADLPFSSRPPRNRHSKQSVNNNNNYYENDLIRKKKVIKKYGNIFYEGETSERYFNGPPFSLNCKKYEDDYDTIEAHARFCKAKIPGKDIDESEKMIFFSKLKSDNLANHYKTYFVKENESYDLNHDFTFSNNKKSSKSTKISPNLKKMQGSFPSFCKPYHERIKELIDKETSNQKSQAQSNFITSNNQNMSNYDSSNLSDDENKGEIKENFEINPIDIEKTKKKIKKVEYTPNIHVTRRLKSYYLAKNMDLPEFLERIDPVPLRYDKILHYHPDPD